MRLKMTLNTRLTPVPICLLGPADEVQDRGDWQSLAQLRAGDKKGIDLFGQMSR
jgi:hypothetical protein